MKIIKYFKRFVHKIREFVIDEHGGNLVEYALLIGFALFIFFLLVSVVTSMLDWTLGQSSQFSNATQGLDE